MVRRIIRIFVALILAVLAFVLLVSMGARLGDNGTQTIKVFLSLLALLVALGLRHPNTRTRGEHSR